MQRHLRETLEQPVTSTSAPRRPNPMQIDPFDNSPSRESAVLFRRELRRHFRRVRRGLDHQRQVANAAAVARHLQTSTLLLDGGRIAAYLPNQKDGELDSIPCVQRLWVMGRTVSVPVIGRNAGFMDLYRLRPATKLVLNRLGIAEPEPGTLHVNVRSVALMLMPLVAFDDAGTRLGMGGGFYDRFLGALPPALRPRLVGIAHEAQRSAEPLPRDRWDIPLDAVITELGVTRFQHRPADMET